MKLRHRSACYVYTARMHYYSCSMAGLFLDSRERWDKAIL
jgi:hypothetical protein